MLLVWLIALPFLAGAITFFLPRNAAKFFSLVSALAGFGLSVFLYQHFDGEQSHSMQLVFSRSWISALGVQFAFGVDGLSFPLVMLTKFMVPVALLASWNESRRTSALMALFLMLDFAMTGTFLATDLFLFYVFWELMLIPMILIIGIWGSQDRIYASLKFFLYTFAGSVLMLVAILWLYVAHQQQFGFASANIASLRGVSFPSEVVFCGLTPESLVFWAFTLAFLIKVPLFPLHTWLPDAHVQAPTGGSILLAAVLLKMGTYGLMRFSIPFCPHAFARFAPCLAGLSLVGILYGAWVAFQQTDFKKLVAYSSVSHLAYVVLGLCTSNGEGITGAVLQSVNHGLSTGALFFLVGALYDRRHSRNFADYGGLAEVIPKFAVALVFVACSSMAVPGLNGFVGEFLILFGAWKHNYFWAIFAVTGVVFGAAYTLIMVRKVLFGGNVSVENRTLKDLSKRELSALLPLGVMMIALGIQPNFFLKKFERSIREFSKPSEVKQGSVVFPKAAVVGRERS